MHRATVAVALLVACGGSTTDVTIALTDVNGDCTTAFASVNAISIEVIKTNGACRLAHECATTNVSPKTLDAATQALHDTADILLELDAGDAQTLVINGRPQKSCFPSVSDPNEPVLCGYAPIGSAKDGVLVIELSPDQLPGEPDLCPESMPLCP